MSGGAGAAGGDRQLEFVTADVFTDRVFGGNPLAVIPDGRGLDPAAMQIIAREFNLSETVFVLPPDDPVHTRRLRIFTPAAELPFAGHPTIGTALMLAELGLVPLAGERSRIVFEEGAGPVPVSILSEGGRPVSAQLQAPKAPEMRPAPAATQVAAIVGLTPDDLTTANGLPVAVSSGVPFLIVEVRDRGALGRCRLDRLRWQEGLAGSWAEAILMVTRDAPEGHDLQGRMFAPAMGIEEDPATGAAAAALGGFLGTRPGLADGAHHWILAQGIEMGRPSRLEIEAERRDGALQAVRVAGAAALVMRGTLTLPAAG